MPERIIRGRLSGILSSMIFGQHIANPIAMMLDFLGDADARFKDAHAGHGRHGRYDDGRSRGCRRAVMGKD